MAKRLNVDVSFNADTSQAKAAIQELNGLLKNIQTTPSTLVDDVSLQKASQAASELQRHLQAAVNTDTGKLDLGRFSQSLQKSGKDLQHYYSTLSKIGPQGQQAFLALSRSIANADASTLKLNSKFKEFTTTLKNTARWQLSSSVLHGLMGAVQSAYGYAKDLDRSLNDIRIVTGKTADEMDSFAEKANRAAQSLSTTTTEYTNAALIFYQQGLGSSEVEARTNATIKMAHAAGESAEEVSSYMTAIWNNFDDGSKSLEYYGDVMTQLGAKTAASSAEIAEGLEKFAAIGETVGLSYEYATSAVATVVDKTRQSADTVGTAFKTIFSRLQGLQLGETLDDGTDLNKYSSALLSVGINIKEANGSLKDMDVILDELGAKWQTLHRDEQMALAQTVAGTRQYTQLMSLMNNYDSFTENVEIAEGSEGALDLAAERYSQSWEGARDRVTAAMEGIYDSLINENFFISMDNGLTVLLNGVEGLIDGLGGMKGLIFTIGGLFAQHFAKEMPRAIQSLSQNFKVLTGKAASDATKMQSQNQSILDGMDTTNPDNKQWNAQIEGLQTVNRMTEELAQKQHLLSESEKQAYQTKIETVQAVYDLIAAKAQELEVMQKQTDELEEQAIKQAADNQVAGNSKGKAREEKIKESHKRKKGADGKTQESEHQKQSKAIKKQVSELKKLIKDYEKLDRVQRKMKEQVKVWEENKDEIENTADNIADLKDKISQYLGSSDKIDQQSQEFIELAAAMEDPNASVQDLIDKFKAFANADAPFDKITTEADQLMQKIDGLHNELIGMGVNPAQLNQLEEAFREGAISAADYEQSLENLRNKAQEGVEHQVKMSEAVTKVVGAASSLAGVMTSFESSVSIFTDEDASAVQKFGAAIGLLTTLMTGYKAVTEALNAVEQIRKTTAAASAATQVAGSGAIAAAKGAETAAVTANTAAWFSNPVTAIIAGALMLVVAAIGAVSGAMQANSEKIRENAEASKEDADAKYEEIQANNELVKSYEDALTAYKNGTGSKEDLQNATEALLAVYEVENAALLVAKGNYDALADSIRNAEQAKLDAAIADTELAIAQNEAQFESTMRDGDGRFSGGNYIVDFNDGASAGDETDVKAAIENLKASGDITSSIDTDGVMTLTTGQSAEDMMKAYEDVQAIIIETRRVAEENGTLDELGDSEVYEQMVSWLAKSEESYNNLVALQGQLNDLKVQEAVNTVTSKDEYADIDSMEEYLAMEQELADTLAADKSLGLTAEEAKELAQAALQSEAAFAEMATASQVIEQAAASTNGAITDEEMQEFYKGLSEDEQKLFATLNFDSAQSVDDLKEQLGVLQARADKESIQVKLDTVENAQSQLKSGMGVDDYKEFETSSGIDWGNEEEGIIEYSDFLSMSYAEQANYLESLNDKYTSELNGAIDASIQANKERIAAIDADLTTATGTLSEYQNAWNTDLGKESAEALQNSILELDATSSDYQTKLQELSTQYGIPVEDLQTYHTASTQVSALSDEMTGLGEEINALYEEQNINDLLNFQEAREEVLALQETLSGLEVGDTIDADEMLTLTQYMPELASEFEKTASGAYKLTGELENIYVAMSKCTDVDGTALFSDIEIAGMIPDLESLREALDANAISAEAFGARWIELNEQLDLEGLDSEELEDYADHLQQTAKNSEMLSEELETNDDAAKVVAKSIMKMNKGVEALAEGFEDWSDVLENSSEESEEYFEAMEGMREAMSDLLDVSEDFVSNDFITENLEDIEKAAQGDEEAIDRLRNALAQDMIYNIAVQNGLESEAPALLSQVQALQASMPDLKVGASIDLENMSQDEAAFIEQCNNLIRDAGMTVEQANAMFDALGFETTFVEEEQQISSKKPITKTVTTDSTEVKKYPDGTEVVLPATETYSYTSGYVDVQETVMVPAMSTDGNTPQIKTLTKKAGGAANNYSSGNKGGGSPGGGGGGGGGAKEAKKENKKSAKDEKERYHVVLNQLEDLEAQYDAISKAKDRAFGKAKLKLMDDEIAKQKQIIAKQKEYISQIQKNYNNDKGKMKDYGAKFDGNGTITNYDSLVESQVKKYNDAVAKYNSLSAEAQEALDKEWANKKDENGQYYSGFMDYAEREYSNFTEALSQYEDSQDLLRDETQKLLDEQNELFDMELEKIDYKVQLQIEFSDDELEHLEYLLERIEAKGFSAAEAIANLGQQTQAVFNKSDAYKNGIMEIFGQHGLTEDDMNAWLAGDEDAAAKVAGLNLTDAQVEKLREYTAGLRDNNEALIEMRQAVHDKMLETFDEWNEKIDRNIDKLDHLKSMTESYRNIVDLVGKANFAGGAETIERLNASTVKQAGNYAQANIANRDRIAEQLQATRDAYAAQKDTISEEERKMWEDTIKEMEDQLNEAEEAAMGSIEEWMEAINQQFLDSVTNTMDKFADAVAGRFANLNELSEAFERQQSVNDRYLESYEKIYEFSKLNRDIEKSIDQTDNIKAKKELADLQAEINALEESGAEVSEYQMENLRKRYELKMAELALEEAQNAKSEVRMTRDNEGNWGYVYTADETQVAEAEQNYEDKLYELQQQNAEYINQLQESIITMQQEMYDKMQEIAQDESLSIEERQAKMQEVQAYYQEQMGYYYSELELVLGNNKVLYEDDWQKYSDMTGYKIASDEEYVDSFDETAYSVLTGFQTMEDAQGAFNTASETMLDENLTAMDNWQTSMETGPLAAMGSSFETLAEDIDRELGNIETESDNTTQEIKDDCDDSVEAYNGVLEAVIAWENQYSQSVDAMIGYSDNLISKFNEVLALWADVKSAAEEAEDPPTPDDGGDDGGDNGGNNGGGGGDGKPSWDRVVAAYNKINGGKWGNGLQNRINKGKSDGFTEAEVRAGQQLINYTYPPNLNGYGYSREKAKSLMGYDTGGYTGEWGDTSGRLALLHQKELVLNEDDTSNFLSAIEMIRQISSLIDLNAMSSMKGLGGMLAAGGVGQTMGGIEQHIEIHASFPDATDHSEIEEAFHNLLNSASQYANRKL